MNHEYQHTAATEKGSGGLRGKSGRKSGYSDYTGPESLHSVFSKKVYRWTKKMSHMSCGAASLPGDVLLSDSQEEGHQKQAVTSQLGGSFAKAYSSDDKDELDLHTHATHSTAAETRSYSLDDAEMLDGGFVQDTHVVPYTHHSFKSGTHTFTVDTKYSFIRTVGSGAYGVVVSAKNAETDCNVAIKMIPQAFTDEIDAKRILREIKLMKHLRHDNICGINDMMPPIAKYVEDFHDVYIVADLMETDLHRIIYSKQSLSIDHVQYFLYQIFRGLKYIHSANVLHRDLKPSNLLVNSNCDLKICDFGLARGILPEEDNTAGGSMLLTEYVVTRWYRAPEIMLACQEYSFPVDVWSVGCIFAELLRRKPYFPGENYTDQLSIITEKLGKPTESDLNFVTSEKAKKFMRKLSSKPAPSFIRQFPGAPPLALDLLRKTLQIHPKKRITVDEAMQHPFFAKLHCKDDEPVAEKPFDFSFEDEKLKRTRLKELIWKEVGDFRPSCLPVAPHKNTYS